MKTIPTLKHAIFINVIFILSILFIGCTPINEPYYPKPKNAINFDSDRKHDLAYVEFSEHGNLFNRDIYDEIEDNIQETTRSKRIAVVVFVHGWHNNSKSENAEEFEILLNELASLKKFENHRVIGLYIGWRGSSVSIPGIEYLTYWDRKTVSDEIASGGVSEILLRLERLVRNSNSNIKNEELTQFDDSQLIILGHSLGGGIVFSALSEVFTDRLINAKRLDLNECERFTEDKSGRYTQKRGADCVLVEKFAHAVVLINPAIEANRAFQLKEIISSQQYTLEQRTLMHVLSTEADWANKHAFRIGQWLKNLTWRESEISRKYRYPREEPISRNFKESELTTTTIGNYPPYRTGYMGKDNDYKRCWDSEERVDCKLGKYVDQYLPSSGNEPILFIQTNEWFMKSHNDVLNNCKVRSYILAIAEESIQTDKDIHFAFGDIFENLIKACPPEKDL